MIILYLQEYQILTSIKKVVSAGVRYFTFLLFWKAEVRCAVR